MRDERLATDRTRIQHGHNHAIRKRLSRRIARTTPPRAASVFRPRFIRGSASAFVHFQCSAPAVVHKLATKSILGSILGSSRVVLGQSWVGPGSILACKTWRKCRENREFQV